MKPDTWRPRRRRRITKSTTTTKSTIPPARPAATERATMALPRRPPVPRVTRTSDICLMRLNCVIHIIRSFNCCIWKQIKRIIHCTTQSVHLRKHLCTAPTGAPSPKQLSYPFSASSCSFFSRFGQMYFVNVVPAGHISVNLVPCNY